MRIDLSAWSLRLPVNAALRLSAARGVKVRGIEGRVWLTEEGSLADVFLCQGDAHVIASDGRVVIQADRDAVLVLEAAASKLLPTVRLPRPTERMPHAALPLCGGRYAAA